MVLNETPEMVGIAQMTLLLPGMLLMLIGGSVADRSGARRVAAIGQLAAGFAPLMLIAMLLTDSLTLTGMLVYALIAGAASAFVTPARDGLLSQVAGGRIQRTVMLTSIVQFGMQILGSLAATLADTFGGPVILATQALVMLAGAIGYLRIRDTAVIAKAARPSLAASVAEGARTVLGSVNMRNIVMQNVAMALFFMGSFVVTLPLLVREAFAGTAADLGFMNAANSLGLVCTILLLVRAGDIRRQGRALLLAQGIGAVVLGLTAFAPNYPSFIAMLFMWGSCGGVAMTMSRTIMLEQAPDAQRGRVMGFFAFSFMGAGPVGALVNGLLVERIGARQTLALSAVLMGVVVLVMAWRSTLWRLEGHSAPV
jgi:MFS family permease